MDKRKVAQSFSRAASTYDAVANLQRLVGARLWSFLPRSIEAGTVILDLGSGTGFFSQQFNERFPRSTIIGLDIAEGMLRFAAQKHSNGPSWICADAECLPLADNSVDIIFSSLAIQWCSNFKCLAEGLMRILKPGGRVIFSTLGPHTLHELKSAWSEVDSYIHVNQFDGAANILSTLKSLHFIVENYRQENEILNFESLSDLTFELKALGAHNINLGKPEGLTGRAKLTAFKQAYENFRTEQGLPATYEIIYVAILKSTVIYD